MSIKIGIESDNISWKDTALKLQNTERKPLLNRICTVHTELCCTDEISLQDTELPVSTFTYNTVTQNYTKKIQNETEIQVVNTETFFFNWMQNITHKAYHIFFLIIQSTPFYIRHNKIENIL